MTHGEQQRTDGTTESRVKPSKEEQIDALMRVMSGTGCSRRHVENMLLIGSIDVAGKERWMKAMQALLKYTEQGSITALLGPRGTGKTQMATCAIHNMKFQGKQAEYMTAMSLFNRLKDCFSSDERQQLILSAFERPQLLVIDEIDVRSGSQWETDMMTHIIDRRYGAVKSTVLISNMTKDVFVKTISESIVDRIKEAGGIIACGWDSFRPYIPTRDGVTM